MQEWCFQSCVHIGAVNRTGQDPTSPSEHLERSYEKVMRMITLDVVLWPQQYILWFRHKISSHTVTVHIVWLDNRLQNVCCLFSKAGQAMEKLNQYEGQEHNTLHTILLF